MLHGSPSIYTVSGESNGWAFEIPAQPRNNMQVSIIQFFDMTTPFGVYAHDVGYLRVVAHDGNSGMSRG